MPLPIIGTDGKAVSFHKQESPRGEPGERILAVDEDGDGVILVLDSDERQALVELIRGY